MRGTPSQRADGLAGFNKGEEAVAAGTALLAWAGAEAGKAGEEAEAEAAAASAPGSVWATAGDAQTAQASVKNSRSKPRRKKAMACCVRGLGPLHLAFACVPGFDFGADIALNAAALDLHGRRQ